MCFSLLDVPVRVGSNFADESDEAEIEKRIDSLPSMSELEKESRWKPWNSLLDDECGGVRAQKSADMNEREERDAERECATKNACETQRAENNDKERVKDGKNSTNKALGAKSNDGNALNAQKNKASSETEDKSLEGLVHHVIKSIKKLGIK